MSYIIIKNVYIIDGTGRDAYKGNVVIKDGKIVSLDTADVQAELVIDGTEKYLTPGFIDSHGHNDLTLPFMPSNKFKLEQGVTTEVSGCCGETLFPVSKKNFQENNLANAFINLKSADKNFHPETYTTGAKWFEYVESCKIGTNMLMLVGHGAIRSAVMGFESRAASQDEMKQMKDLLAECMNAGAAGMSTGIAYAPGVFASEEEIVELCKIVAEYNGCYCTHMRNQGNDLISSIQETLKVTRKTGVRTVISHLKSIGRMNWGKIEQVCKLVEKAQQEENLPVTWDAYPYCAGSTTLKVTLPPSLLEGGNQKLVQKIKEEKWQNYVREQIKHPTEKWENAIGSNGFMDIFILSAPNTPQAEGKSIQEYADLLQQDPFKVYFDLIIDNMETADVKTINFVMCEEDLKQAILSPYSMIGSDGMVINEKEQTHPRGIGTFPRYLGRYVKTQKSISIEQAIRKITGLAADFYGLHTKGYLKVGYDADCVLLDYSNVMDYSKFGDCFHKNEGIEMVMVNGNIVVEKNVFNGNCCGKILKHKIGEN